MELVGLLLRELLRAVRTLDFPRLWTVLALALVRREGIDGKGMIAVLAEFANLAGFQVCFNISHVAFQGMLLKICRKVKLCITLFAGMFDFSMITHMFL